MFDLMFILLKNNLNVNKNNFLNCCFYLIISRCKIAKYGMSDYVWGSQKCVTTCDKDGGGVNKSWNSCYVIYGCPLMGLPLGRFPSIFVCSIFLGILSSPISITCPNHLNLLFWIYCFYFIHSSFCIFSKAVYLSTIGLLGLNYLAIAPVSHPFKVLGGPLQLPWRCQELSLHCTPPSIPLRVFLKIEFLLFP